MPSPQEPKDVYDDKHQLGFKRAYEPQQCDRHTEGHTTKKGLHYHWIMSGHCSTHNPVKIHQQCKGSYGGNGTVVNCICYCHHLDRQVNPGIVKRVRRPEPEPEKPKAKRVVRPVRKQEPAAEAQPAAPARRVRRPQPR